MAVPAIVADFGPAKELGEGSMKLSGALGYGIDPGYARVERRAGGTSRREVVFLVFPRTRGSADPAIGRDWPREVSQLNAAAAERFAAWGGVERLQRCAVLFQ